ncbi:ribonuclease H-like protein [Neolentinus lepideus HHB14362 ss-1]|uniref:3'-5' exonuclease n=1 Tax=Neolentinus lepideus HHB14362 ss-1 TaxID=1314782 RepID=A0A165NAU0_9AGAM|nr:ribonuclease H-like protein [Neolentinus lepideus HHB14362 ss-1]
MAKPAQEAMASSSEQQQQQQQENKPKPPPLPPYSWRDRNVNGRLVYIRDHEQADLECSRITEGSLGFDLEWKPTYVSGEPTNKVALVQLANADCVLLLQVSAMSKFPENLKALLNDPNIVKAGCGIQYDCKKLYADHGVVLRNCVDLSCLARSVDNAQWKGKYNQPIGLARLVSTYEKQDLPKGKVQRSNWERNPLTPQQQEYAANDAHSGWLMYTRLIALADTVEPKPLQVYYTFDVSQGRLYDPGSTSLPWSPTNPNYDPGPLPPPKEKKDKRERKPRPPRDGAQAAEGAREVADAIRQQRPPRRRPGRPKETGPTVASVSIPRGAMTTEGLASQTVPMAQADYRGRGRGGGYRGRL